MYNINTIIPLAWDKMSNLKEMVAPNECLLTPSKLLSIQFQRLNQILGPTTTSIILYKIGKDIGALVHRKFNKEIKANDEATWETRLNDHLQHCQLTIISYDFPLGKIVIRSRNTLLGSKLRNLGIPVDFVCSGCISATLEHAIGRRVTCEEIKCIARGDECCEFVATLTKARTKIEIDLDAWEVKENLDRIFSDQRFRGFFEPLQRDEMKNVSPDSLKTLIKRVNKGYEKNSLPLLQRWDWKE